MTNFTLIGKTLVKMMMMMMMMTYTGVGCGNCVLKIYTNNSGLPAYELCGENKTYIGKTILSQGDSMRLKYAPPFLYFRSFSSPNPTATENILLFSSVQK